MVVLLVSTFEIVLFGVADESGCEADMAEGGPEEDSGDVMLAAAPPVVKRELKTEVR